MGSRRVEYPVELLRDHSDIEAVIELARRDPVSYVLALTHLEDGLASGALPGEVWAYRNGGELVAACWVGANFIPIFDLALGDGPDHAAALSAFIAAARLTGRRSSSLVGPAQTVLPLWNAVEDLWSPAREVRASQPSMVWDREPQCSADRRVRCAEPEDFDALLPASVHMFLEEVGVSPLRYGSVQYSRRVRELIAERRSFVMLRRDVEPGCQDSAGDQIVFKADIGALCNDVAQVQGVWIDPAFRSRGIAAPAMAQVAQVAQEQFGRTISLYVNSYNYRALKAYQTSGFSVVGEYATVMF